jgi:hypothetical protein
VCQPQAPLALQPDISGQDVVPEESKNLHLMVTLMALRTFVQPVAAQY